MQKKKLVYISHVAVPTQIKLCYALQSYLETEFWFYDSQGERPDWWKIDFGSKCKVLSKVFFKKKAKYFTFSHLFLLNKLNPDILMLGGFVVPANLFAYWWAKWKKKKVVVFTERSRDINGNLRRKSIIWRMIRYLYKDIDLILVASEDTVPQFRDEFGFGNKVVASQYASDIDKYLNHPIRIRKENNNYKILFPNRLISIYNPTGAITIFSKLITEYPNLSLTMNGAGDERVLCEELIIRYGLKEKVIFLDNIENWEKLHEEYEKCDIMFLPANFSNGNFTIIEAMASGMGIVISKKILGVGLLIENEKNGYNCEHNEEKYLLAIKRYIDNPDLFKKHGHYNKNNTENLGIAATAKLYSEQLLGL